MQGFIKRLLVVTILFFLCPAATAAPLELDLNKNYNSLPKIQNYKYWFGDISWGTVVYLRSPDLEEFETELQISFEGKKISQILFVLGPSGLNVVNCFDKHKKMVKVLNKKYGHFLFKKIIKDPLMEDLFYMNVCSPVLVGLYEVQTLWRTKEMAITMALFGDEEYIFIEVEYRNVFFKKEIEFKKMLKTF